MQRGHLMQMAQRKRQHEREEASEDEEYSEEEGEEYFEEGEEEERSFDPEEASESDDSRDWNRRSRYKSDPPPPPPPPPYTPGFGLAIRAGWTSQGRLWLAGGFTRRIRCGRRGNGQDPCQNFFVQEAISVGSGSTHGMKKSSVVLQSTA